MEWIKLRSLRSTWWTPAVTAAGTVGIAAAVGILVAGVYVIAQVVGFIAHGAAAYVPILILENSLSTTRPVSCGPSCPEFLSAWAGLGVLSLYAAIALTVGGWLLAKRDA